jgi:gliding motility-associated-like protein
LRNRLIILLGLICLGFSAQGQVTTEGQDFWFGFMHNQNASDIEIYISAEVTTSVTIDSPLDGYSTTAIVNPGVSTKVVLPLRLMPETEGKFDFAFHVTSDNPISLYALNKREFSADAAVILPTPALGQEYYVVAHMEPPADIVADARESEFLVVATEDNTEIEITPSGPTFGGWPRGLPQTILLNAGQTYQVKSNEDLSGSYVRTIGQNASDCKNIAVFGGNVFTNVGGCGPARDHLLEQMFPLTAWGKNFLFVPYETRRGGDYLKIIASEDNTIVNISGEEEIELRSGEVYRNKALEGVRTISSNKPITVAQFSRSQDCDGVPSDPFMIIVSPLEQRIKSVTFNAFIVQNINNYYLTLITESSALRDIVLDGNDITNRFIVVGNAAYASLNISQGNHSLSAPEGVIAYVYGYGNAESFGYSAGASLENLNAELILQDEFISIVDDQACINSEINFKIQFEIPLGEEPRYDTFDWHFDDGTTASGQEVQHTYTVAGDYEITLIASKDVGSCGTSETFTKTITIQEVEAQDLIGPQSVCPDVTGIEYSVSGPDENSYQWIVSPFDGDVVSGQGSNRVLVDWGSPNDNAYVKVVPINGLGCIGDTLTLPVKINKLLEPPIPVGPAEVCFLDFESVKYSTPVRNGSQFIWEVEGGSFLPNPSSNTSNEVTVKWDGVGSGRLWYTESNSLVDDCDGISDVLEVTIFPEIIAVESIDNVSCNGFSDGSITLALSGGKTGNYQVSWDNGQTGLTASNLVAGDYVATITDAANCAVQKTYTVTEPAVLVLTAEPIPVRCFQETNGMITFSAVGGTPNAQGLYRFNVVGAGINRTTSEAMITNLRAGTYMVTVTDNNSCVDTKEVIVTEPPLLEPIVESLINQPICPQATNGTTFIEAMGGTPEYQFYWSNNPTEDSQDGSGFSQGTYSVRIVDANGCETSLGFEVVERYPKLFIPNAFSPNNDGVNDVFKPVTDCQLQYSMQIFNKWGAIVFATEDITRGWDGRVNGNKVQDGQYSYIIFYAGSINGVSFEETRRGSLKLYR